VGRVSVNGCHIHIAFACPDIAMSAAQVTLVKGDLRRILQTRDFLCER
jgi:cation transport ATPase